MMINHVGIGEIHVLTNLCPSSVDFRHHAVDFHKKKSEPIVWSLFMCRKPAAIGLST